MSKNLIIMECEDCGLPYYGIKNQTYICEFCNEANKEFLDYSKKESENFHEKIKKSSTIE